MSTHPVALITGASSGIGEATARYFAAKGWRVVIAARRADQLEQLANHIQHQGGQVLPVPTDTSKVDRISQLVQTTLEHYGQINLLFNNAGFGKLGWLESLHPGDDIIKQLQVNLLGTILLSREVLPHMIHRQRGHIINMSSVAGMIGIPTYSIYAASKFGIIGFSEALRREVSIYGIHVSTICPGSVETSFKQNTGATSGQVEISTTNKWVLAPEDVARRVYLLTKRPRPIVVFPAYMRLLIWFNRFSPKLADAYVARRFVQPKRDHPPKEY